MPADLILLVLVAVMFFVIFGQNRKRRLAAEQLARDVAVGDEVTLHSGIVGKVAEATDDELTIESAGSKIRVLRAAVRSRSATEEK